VSYFFGNGHKQDDSLRVTTRMKGTIEMDIPYLAQANPELFSILDSLAIDPSASNAWNAIPWSWFIDWFVPVGDYLESLPSAMKPLTRFCGTFSHQISSHSLVTSAYTGPAYFVEPGFAAGQLSAKIYLRDPAFGSTSSLIKWSFGGLSNPAQFAVLRDIMFPVKSR